MQPVMSSDTLAGAVLRAQAAVARFATPGGLEAAGHLVSTAADDLRCGALLPASSAGAMAAAAALLGEARGMELVNADDIQGGSRRILVVEAVAVSGLNVRTAVERARSAGVHWVGVVVCHHESASGSEDGATAPLACWGSPDELVLGSVGGTRELKRDNSSRAGIHELVSN